ncbi:MAG: class I SAM-dependent methyltransferase [Bacillota bacterium]|jgi:tRNA (adenine22-N1)-methyltransferase
MRTLPGRLKSIASMVRPGTVAADVGTGHGLLAVYLVASGVCPGVIATEVNPMPLVHARDRAAQEGVSGMIEFRLGWGLEPLAPGEAGCIIVAGLGGDLMLRVLLGRPEVARAAPLVLGPVAREESLRRGLLVHGFRITQEDIVMDRGRIYQTIAAEAGDDAVGPDVFLEIGPRAWEMRHPLIRCLISRRIERYGGIIREMEKGAGAKASSRLRAYRRRLDELLALREDLDGEAQG